MDTTLKNTYKESLEDLADLVESHIETLEGDVLWDPQSSKSREVGTADVEAWLDKLKSLVEKVSSNGFVLVRESDINQPTLVD